MGNIDLVSYETIVRAPSGDQGAVDEVLRHYSKRIRKGGTSKAFEGRGWT